MRSLLIIALSAISLVAAGAATKGVDDLVARTDGPIPPQTGDNARESNRAAPHAGKGVPTAMASGVSTYIIGGDVVTTRSEYPYFVHLGGCGAFLIQPDIAMSAAHCSGLAVPFQSQVLVNGIVRGEGIQRAVTRVEVHPYYDGFRTDYDYMLIKLDSSALVDEDGSPTGAATIDINTQRDIPQPDDPLINVGFGRPSNDVFDGSDVLLDVEFEYMADDVCLERWGNQLFLPEVMFCAGVPEGGKGSCNGDSGGPVVDKATGTAVGVVSYGSAKECASATLPNVYARVSGAKTWIQNTVCALTEMEPKPDYCDGTEGPIVPDPGPGDVTLLFDFDGSANETSFSFTHDDSGYVYAYATYNDFDDSFNNGEYSLSLNDLPVGNYTLAVNDAAGDGFCNYYDGGCKGAFAVRDDNSDSSFFVYINDSFSWYYIGVKLQIDNDGVVSFRYETFWPGSSFEEAPNYPQVYDESWPGPQPTDTGNIYFNLKFDDFPGETRWVMYQHVGDGTEWDLVASYNGGTDAPFNELLSWEFNDLEPGWYHLAVQDTSEDGICCYFRRGWLALTGFVEVTAESGLIWGNNGEFGAGTEVYFLLSADGMVSEFTMERPAESRL